ncbi:MAG TPA: hypothetical protein VGG05_21175 [Pseudonocardiaceae bacterium]
MERTDWLDAGLDPGRARFLMVTAITHHRFSSSTWNEAEVLKLFAELRQIEDLLLGELEPILSGREEHRGYPRLGINPILASVDE